MFNKTRVTCSTDLLRRSHAVKSKASVGLVSSDLSSTSDHVKMIYTDEDSAVRAARYIMNQGVLYVKRG